MRTETVIYWVIVGLTAAVLLFWMASMIERGCCEW